MTGNPRLYDEKGASAYLKAQHSINYAVRTLQKLRCVGGGPRFRKVASRVYYDEISLDEWASHMVSPPVQSTSDPALLRHQSELTQAAA